MGNELKKETRNVRSYKIFDEDYERAASRANSNKYKTSLSSIIAQVVTAYGNGHTISITSAKGLRIDEIK